MDETIAAVDRAVELAPNEAAYWDSQGEVYLALQQYEEALAKFDHARSLSAEAGFAWRRTAKALRALGREAEVDEAARRGKELGFA